MQSGTFSIMCVRRHLVYVYMTHFKKILFPLFVSTLVNLQTEATQSFTFVSPFYERRTIFMAF